MNTINYIQDLTQSLTEIPSNSILSRTIHKDEKVKVILFSFAVDQELSEHTASVPTLLHFLEGEAEVRLGEQNFQSQAGSWAYLPPHTPHTIHAKTPLKMLLYMLSS